MPFLFQLLISVMKTLGNSFDLFFVEVLYLLGQKDTMLKFLPIAEKMCLVRNEDKLKTPLNLIFMSLNRNYFTAGKINI